MLTISMGCLPRTLVEARITNGWVWFYCWLYAVLSLMASVLSLMSAAIILRGEFPVPFLLLVAQMIVSWASLASFPVLLVVLRVFFDACLKD